MTTFKYALQICGLSQSEAAEYFYVSIDSVKGWAQGRRLPPAGVWQMLAELHKQIRNDSYRAFDSMQNNGGIPEGSFSNIAADFEGENELPNESAKCAAGAMALLMMLAPDDFENA